MMVCTAATPQCHTIWEDSLPPPHQDRKCRPQLWPHIPCQGGLQRLLHVRMDMWKGHPPPGFCHASTPLQHWSPHWIPTLPVDGVYQVSPNILLHHRNGHQYWQLLLDPNLSRQPSPPWYRGQHPLLTLKLCWMAIPQPWPCTILPLSRSTPKFIHTTPQVRWSQNGKLLYTNPGKNQPLLPSLLVPLPLYRHHMPPQKRSWWF